MIDRGCSNCRNTPRDLLALSILESSDCANFWKLRGMQRRSVISGDAWHGAARLESMLQVIWRNEINSQLPSGRDV